MTSGIRNGNREEEEEKRSASGSGEEESGEQVSGEEKSEGIGERFLPSRGEEDEEVADGGLNTAVAPGGKTRNPATLLEKRGTSMCVYTPP
ncbi:hypothetical protein NDU88_007190 [Pleurodeles waltl]|uniref:Uncharacterized protein n=1 Tax=Pleurodeles waltl TaxID=8319 RepID=A0AAV7UNW2_PLEWA|nr:hypothetical protein NDU88_007190 [Pleurodeles waltl]